MDCRSIHKFIPIKHVYIYTYTYNMYLAIPLTGQKTSTPIDLAFVSPSTSLNGRSLVVCWHLFASCRGFFRRCEGFFFPGKLRPYRGHNETLRFTMPYIKQVEVSGWDHNYNKAKQYTAITVKLFPQVWGLKLLGPTTPVAIFCHLKNSGKFENDCFPFGFWPILRGKLLQWF